MSELSKFQAKKGEKTLKDVTTEEWAEIGKEISKKFKIKLPKIELPQNNLKEITDEHLKAQTEWVSQPFKTNYLLENILKSQTPRWVNYTILIITTFALIIGILALLHNYSII